MAKPLLPHFVADVMVGRLARWLRILGFDVLYSNRFADDALIALARSGRILLTRDIPLAARLPEDKVVVIQHDHYEQQIRQVLRRFPDLPVRVLSRCLECNELLRQVDRETIFERVPPYVYLTQQDFAVCPSCGRVFWKGTHTGEMLAKIRRWTSEIP